MRVEWQGDHELLEESGEGQDFEREVKRLGYGSNQFIAVVRREPDTLPGRTGQVSIRNKAHATRLGRIRKDIDAERWTGNSVVAQFVQGT